MAGSDASLAKSGLSRTKKTNRVGCFVEIFLILRIFRQENEYFMSFHGTGAGPAVRSCFAEFDKQCLQLGAMVRARGRFANFPALSTELTPSLRGEKFVA